jgi:hypothetical protein
VIMDPSLMVKMCIVHGFGKHQYVEVNMAGEQLYERWFY